MFYSVSSHPIHSKTFFTNVYLYDPKNLQDIEDTLHLVLEEFRQHGVESDDVEIALDIYGGKDPQSVRYGCYYLCKKESREVFWLENIPDEFFFEGEQHIRILGGEHLSQFRFTTLMCFVITAEQCEYDRVSHGSSVLVSIRFQHRYVNIDVRVTLISLMLAIALQHTGSSY